MPRERPIPFSAPMVRAILNGTKTQTRRVCKPAEAAALSFVVEVPDPQERGQVYTGSHFGDEEGGVQFASPYGRRGDRLWVREPWRVGKPHDDKPPRDIWPRPDGKGVTVLYEAGGWRDMAGRHTYTGDEPMPSWAGRYRHARFMPRWASRITLEVTGVRVERLQAISEANARAEGAHFHDGRGIGHSGWRHDDGAVHANARSAFAHLWESLNGAGSWDANPWVWVIEFRQVTP